MQIQDELIEKLILDAFKISIENENIEDNRKKSSYFVSTLAKLFAKEFDKKALVQPTDKNDDKSSGEWLLDITIVSKKEVKTTYKERKSSIIQKIHWAIESEFSTNLDEFCKDFAKLLHIKSEAYLYIAGLNQTTDSPREKYIEAQKELAKELVAKQGIDNPFYLAFVPTPGGAPKHSSLWTDGFEGLGSKIKVFNISSTAKK